MKDFFRELQERSTTYLVVVGATVDGPPRRVDPRTSSSPGLNNNFSPSRRDPNSNSIDSRLPPPSSLNSSSSSNNNNNSSTNNNNFGSQPFSSSSPSASSDLPRTPSLSLNNNNSLSHSSHSRTLSPEYPEVPPCAELAHPTISGLTLGMG